MPEPIRQPNGTRGAKRNPKAGAIKKVTRSAKTRTVKGKAAPVAGKRAPRPAALAPTQTDVVRGVDPKVVFQEHARTLKAQEDLLRLSKLRLVAEGVKITSQDKVAASLGISQATVHRLVNKIRNDPAALEETPTEIIDRRAVGAIDDDEMMAALLVRSYSHGRHDPTGGDGYIRGTWSEIERALGKGLLSDEEYERLAREAPRAKSARAR